MSSKSWQRDVGILILLALLRIAMHVATDGQYGFHRDELAVLDDARHLAWGYVAYPPITPWIARIALEWFGPSLIGLRFFGALAQAVAMVFTGLIARELGGGRWAQVVAAIAAAIAPVALSMGALFQYITFDYLCWVLVAWLVVRLLRTDRPRLWIAVGAVIGLGMLCKYTMALFAIGIAGGVLLTPARRYLRSPWLWAGVAISLLVFLPNLLWQAQHDFVSLTFLQQIHARDVEIGRADGFLLQQLFGATSVATLPLWLAGLYFYCFAAAGARYRMLGWMYAIPLVLFLCTRGRFYYLAPAYPMLFAAGAVLIERWLAARSRPGWHLANAATCALLIGGGALSAALVLPLAPVGSRLWNIADKVHDDFREELGWRELVATVARIHAKQPVAERPRLGILAGNYGEAGAIDLYGPALGLPRAISGVNSYWLRGYGAPPPQTLIVLGFSPTDAAQLFAHCDVVGQVRNRYGVQNEEAKYHHDILLCRAPRKPWPQLWAGLRSFG